MKERKRSIERRKRWRKRRQTGEEMWRKWKNEAMRRGEDKEDE